MIWPDWFAAEPEEYSNPKMERKKQQSKVQADIVYTDTDQP